MEKTYCVTQAGSEPSFVKGIHINSVMADLASRGIQPPYDIHPYDSKGAYPVVLDSADALHVEVVGYIAPDPIPDTKQKLDAITSVPSDKSYCVVVGGEDRIFINGTSINGVMADLTARGIQPPYDIHPYDSKGAFPVVLDSSDALHVEVVGSIAPEPSSDTKRKLEDITSVPSDSTVFSTTDAEKMHSLTSTMAALEVQSEAGDAKLIQIKSERQRADKTDKPSPKRRRRELDSADEQQDDANVQLKKRVAELESEVADYKRRFAEIRQQLATLIDHPLA